MSDFRSVDLEIDRIDVHPACDVRREVMAIAVDIYADRLKELPPVTVFAKPRANGDGTDHWLADGHHTYLAHLKGGKKFLTVRVMAGTYVDAFRYACNANVELEKTLQRNGVPVYEGDKRHRVEMWCRRPEAKGMGPTQIAEICGVDKSYVSKIAKRDDLLNSQQTATPVIVTNDGKRSAIEAALKADPDATNTEIAERCSVHRGTVAKVRKELAAAVHAEAPAPAPAPPDPEPEAVDPPGMDEDETPPPSARPMPFNAAKEFMALELAILEEFKRWPATERKAFARKLLILADDLRNKTGLVMKEVKLAIPIREA